MQMNSQSIWPHIAQLRPKLRAHVQLYPQVYRGERWYVLHDQSSGQYLRFNESAYAVLGRLDGDLTLEEILEHASEDNSPYLLTQEDIISLIGQLNAAEVLRDGLPVNAREIFQQYKTQQRKKRQRSMMNPLSIKIPFFDPDRLLTRLAPLGRMLFSKAGLWVWLLTIFTALLLGVANADALMSDITAIELSPMQLLALWLIYPLIKALHELGHGLALKTWGGEVHETGINLLLFMPVPYVDATASWGFRNKWKRMLVGAAGIFTELFIAALALFLWLAVEPGLVKLVALNVILIATLSTLLFNGNPLLRYDGYFVLEDWLEIPNLATRSKRYYYYLTQKYILKMTGVRTPVTAEGEEKWFLFYGFAAPLYRLFILLGIALYLVDSFLVVGVALAIWAVIMQLIVPLGKGILFLTKNEAVAPHRLRGLVLIFTLSLGFMGILFIPIPTVTYTEGIVWTVGDSQVTAGRSGFVKNLLVDSGTQVKAGHPIVQLVDPELTAQHLELKSKLHELNTRYVAQQRQSRVKAAMIQDDLYSVRAEFARVSEQIGKLTICSPGEGKFVSAKFKDLTGRYIEQGKVLGHIIDPENLIIRAVVPQSRIGLMKTYETSAEFMLADQPGSIFHSQIIRETPQATSRIPSAALGTTGGGTLAVDPNDKTGTTLLKPVFKIDLALPEDLHLNKVGGRVYVRLNHGDLPIGEQFSLYFNQLFLRHFYAK